MANCIVFWQRMLTPHMTGLARQLALADAEVHYVAEESLSTERREMGWETGELLDVTVHDIATPQDARGLVDRFPANAVHITQGVRANGLIAHAQKRIADRGLRHYAIMETVDLRGLPGTIKPLIYALRFWMIADRIEGLLAIGEGTPEWVAERSPESMKVIPFAYFLKGRPPAPSARKNDVFRFIFVGSLIDLKRVDLMLDALLGLSASLFEVEIIGDGPRRAALEQQANEVLPGRVVFLGTVDMNHAIARISLADCLVLPSAHDGWGAVVSEAQINGTPVVCSSRCGASGTVRASGFGAVFEAGDVKGLRQRLAAQLDMGPITAAGREELATWATCLTAEAGARYLLEIISPEAKGHRIVSPWERVEA